MAVSLDLLMNAVISGLLLGGFYAAVSVGVAISFGLLDVVNIAHPAFILLTVFLTMGVNVYLYAKVPKGFFPQQDTGRLQGNVVGEQHISYQALVDKAKWFEEQVRSDPDVETVTMVAGTSGGGFGGNSANVNVRR